MVIKEIIDGWKNVVVTNSETEIIAERRLSICNKCEFKDTMLNVDVCSQCHCPLIAKVRSPNSECPQDFWVEQTK